ncbi:MAG: Asp23/Gls24 family envelope stress response protein [Bacilli bacterium]
MEENEVKTEETNNDIQIAEDVICVVSGVAIKEIEGVAKVATGFAGGISEAFGKKNLGKGIKVEINEKDVKIDVSIIVKYGAKIPEVALKIQEKIKTDVESMTGLKVISVNVKVQGIESNNESETEKVLKNEIIEEE